MKQLGIVTTSAIVGEFYKGIIHDIIGNDIKISNFSFDTNSFDDPESLENLRALDVILISTFSQYEIVKKHIGNIFNAVIVKLTLSKEGYEIIKSLENVGNVMLVNLSMEMCLETIGLLYQLGFDNFNFTPVYPGMTNIPDIDIAITTGEKQHVPKNVKKVYDLGHRLIDENTIIELLVSLDMAERLTDGSVNKYFEKLIKHNMGIEYLLSNSNILNNQLDTLLSLMDKGVIYVDSKGTIVSCNGSAEKIVKLKHSEMIGKNSEKILPEINFKDDTIINKLIKINENYITLSIYKIINNENEYNGSYAIVEDFEYTENVQNKVRLQMLKKGHIAKYDIHNIVGESPEILEVKDLIKRMAKSNYAVLITGETGTGKELVANAIHNLSNNKDKHFIAINCAAFNASLLESELFGYEPGAFTGASKDGKKGIFEYANNGTLFLDEIGEMPLELQTKLLRVIQEKEFMRVGGHEIIRVDFRVIAATNIDLEKQVEKGLFRKDLYYRLNVLPINIPPLRERKDDVAFLIEDLIKEKGYKFVLEKETIKFLKEYEWDGNIRELINCMEYLDNLGKGNISIEDLPYHIKNKSVTLDINFKKKDLLKMGCNEKELETLKILYEAFNEKKKLGRRSISQKAFEKNISLTEYEVKQIMENLSNKGLVEIGRGRGGTSISSKGIDLIRK